MAKPFLILSLDGGGLRGIVPVLILKKIEQITGKKIQDIFHLMAGTSTGGLIACGLSIGKSPTDLESIYVNDGKTIFPTGGGGIKALLSKVESLFDPKFKADGLQKVLNTYFGTTTYSDCKVPIMACSYDLANNEPMIFKSRHLYETPSLNVQLQAVCRATSAAPTYLPAYELTYGGKKRVCVDGGIYINNPGMAALSEVSHNWKDPYYKIPADFDFERDVFMLSLGTGTYTSDLAQKKWMEGGLINWATKISDIMMQSTNQSTVYESNEMLAAGHYCRMSISIGDPKFSDMTDSSDFTRNYLIQQVEQQLFNQQPVMSNLRTFLRTAGVISAS